MSVAEGDRAAVAAVGRQPQLVGQGPVRHPEEDEVDGVGQVGERRHTGLSRHGPVARVDQPGALDAGTAQHLGGHAQTQGVRPVAGPADRDRAPLEHPDQSRPDLRQAHPPSASEAGEQPAR